MLPALVVKIALLIIIVRCVYVAVTLLNHTHKRWLDILFYFSVAIVALSYFLAQFHSFFGLFP